MSSANVNPDDPVIAFIALGSNLEDPVKQVNIGFDELAHMKDSRLVRASALYSGAPIGESYTGQPDFVNAVAKIETLLSPQALLNTLLLIELKHGRNRKVPNSARTLDLDLLLYGQSKIDETDLIIPHPRMHTRAFVLVPLLEVDDDCMIPDKGYARDWLSYVDKQGLTKIA